MLTKSQALWKRAKKYVASGTMTYSKQAERYVQGMYPEFIEQGRGCYVYDLEGRTYIDYPCGLGAITLGFAEGRVNEAVKRQVDKGSLFSMPSVLEGELAERVNDMFPSMETMRFLKSGSEAVSAGIKIARAYTGRTVVLSNGYHGWHDWSTPLCQMKDGTPEELASTIYEFKYNDLDNLKQLLKSHKVACVVIDPYIFDAPKADYLAALIRLAHRHGALVLFDEVVTGLRWHKFSVQNSYGVKPDLSAFGKGMANGYPISMIGGRREVMRVVEKDCFVSSTFGGELVSIVAALATMRVATDENLPERLEESGLQLISGFNDIAKLYNLDCYMGGSPYRMILHMPTPAHKALFWQECVRSGIIFGGATHTSLAHTSQVIDKTLQVCNEALYFMRDYWDDPSQMLEGKLPQPVFAIQNLRS